MSYIPFAGFHYEIHYDPYEILTKSINKFCPKELAMNEATLFTALSEYFELENLTFLVIALEEEEDGVTTHCQVIDPALEDKLTLKQMRESASLSQIALLIITDPLQQLVNAALTKAASIKEIS